MQMLPIGVLQSTLTQVRIFNYLFRPTVLNEMLQQLLSIRNHCLLTSRKPALQISDKNNFVTSI